MSTVGALSWSVTKIVLRTVGIKERSFMCASITVHVQLVSQVQRYLMCTLNYMYITGLIPELNYFRFAYRHSPWYPRIAFQHFCECHACCGNFNDCPSLLNHLLKSNCFHLPLPLHFLLGIAFLILLH